VISLTACSTATTTAPPKTAALAAHVGCHDGDGAPNPGRSRSVISGTFPVLRDQSATHGWSVVVVGDCRRIATAGVPSALSQDHWYVSETINGTKAKSLPFSFDWADEGLTVTRFLLLVPNSLPAALIRMSSNGWYYYDLLTVKDGRVLPVRFPGHIVSGFSGVAVGHGFTCSVTTTGRLELSEYSFIQRDAGNLADVSETTYVASSDAAMREVSSAHWTVALAAEASFAGAC
jgi:hypothetical protein